MYYGLLLGNEEDCLVSLLFIWCFLSSEKPVVLSDVVDLPLVEEVSVVPVTTELKPPVRPATLSRLSIFSNMFQHLHDFGLF